jgi:hypothetical protein
MIKECIVLFGIQHFEEGAGGITIDTTTDLINFIDQNEGIFRADAFQSLNNLARQSSEQIRSVIRSSSSPQIRHTQHKFFDVL